MNKPTFTKGPWKLEPILLTQLGGKGVYCRAVRQSGGFRIADVFAPSEGVTGTTEKRNEDLANARLIASAPEMHALLARVASDDLGDVQTAVELAMDAREILAKAEGET